MSNDNHILNNVWTVSVVDHEGVSSCGVYMTRKMADDRYKWLWGAKPYPRSVTVAFVSALRIEIVD